jgi:tetratricopeptide (TPR) repeat protein
VDPIELDALIKQAEMFRDTGRPGKARELYNHILTLVPGEEFSTLGLGICDRLEGDRLAALAFYHRAQALHPHSHWPHVEMAEDYFALNRLDEAEAEWRTVLAMWPGEINALRGMVRLARRRGDTNAALAALAALPEQNEEVQLERARLLAALDRREEALALLQDGAAQFPRNPEFLIEISALERLEGNLAGARAALEEAATHDPRNPKALLKLSDLARQVQDPALALAYLTRARQECTPDIWVDLCRGQCLFELGQYAEAEAALTQAQADHDGHFLIAQVRGEQLSKLGRMDEAQALVAEARRAHPGNDSLTMLAAELANRAGHAARAAQLTAALPASSGQLFLAATIAEEAWQREAAATLFQATERAQPDHRGALSAQIRLALLAGDLELARDKLLQLGKLEMPDRRVRGLSANISQSFLGQYYDEYAMEPEALARIKELTLMPAALRLPALLEIAAALPYWTASSCAVLLALREAGLLASGAPGELAIPRRIFQYWHASEPPPDVALLMQSWRAAHPGWRYDCFTDATAQAWLRQNAPEALPAYLRTRDMAQKSDILRLTVLWREGGWYADADDRCFAPLPSLGTGAARLVAYQEEFASLGNNLLGAQAGHPVIGAALAEAIASLQRGDTDIVWLATGPGLLSRSFVATLLTQGENWPDFLQDVAILKRPELRRAVTPHCHAHYKVSGQHWSDAQFRKQAALAQPVSEAEPAP